MYSADSVSGSSLNLVSFELVFGSECDVYILHGYAVDPSHNNTSELGNYRRDRNFEADFCSEQTKGFEKEWRGNDDLDFTLVVDNRDNVRSSDAVPEGPIVFNLKYETVDDFWMVLGCLTACGIICCAVVVLVFLGDKRRKSQTWSNSQGYRNYHVFSPMAQPPPSTIPGPTTPPYHQYDPPRNSGYQQPPSKDSPSHRK